MEAERRAAQWLREGATRVRSWTGAAVAAGLAAGLLTVLQAGLVATLVAGALDAAQPASRLLGVAALLGLCIVARAALQAAQQQAGITASQRIRAQRRSELLAHIGALGPLRLGERHSAGLASRLVEQVDALDGYHARYLPQRLLAVLLPLLIGGAVFAVDWLAGLLLFIAAPLIPLFMALVGIGAARISAEQFALLTRLAARVQDRLQGLATLRLFGATDRAASELADDADAYRGGVMRTLRVAFLSSAVLEFFASVAIAMLAIYIGFGLLGFLSFGPAPELDLRSGLFMLLLAPDFFQPLRSLAQHYHDRAAALGASRQLLDVLDRPLPPTAITIGAEPNSALRTAEADIAAADAPMQLPPMDGETLAVQLDQIGLRPAGRAAVLRGVDLRLGHGEVVVLRGASGAGKSTLLHLVAGFVSPDAGRVRVLGGAPGAQPIGWLGQQPYVAAGSLADNIRMARPAADDDAVHAVAEAAGVLAYARHLPQGLQHRIHARGHGLSGGEARRLALARALLAEAELLLLDEPTAQLDAESEAAIIDALAALRADGRRPAMLIASHHPAVAALADRVLELRDGQLHEVPSHA